VHPSNFKIIMKRTRECLKLLLREVLIHFRFKNPSCFIILIEVKKIRVYFLNYQIIYALNLNEIKVGRERGGYLQQIVIQICLTKHCEEKHMEQSQYFKSIFPLHTFN